MTSSRRMAVLVVASVLLVGSPSSRPDLAVFVPAVMGAGIVLSIATLLRDLVAQGRRELIERRALIRAPALDDWVARGAAADPWNRMRPAPRWTIAAIGALACGFGVYVVIGTTGNFLRPAGYVHHIAWLWGASLAVAALGIGFGAGCLIVAALDRRAPTWAWSLVVATPLVGRRRVEEHQFSRTALVAGFTVVTMLMILATWPHVLDPVDRRVTDAVDRTPVGAIEAIGETLGSTELAVALAVLVGLGTLRCRRFALIYVVSFITALASSAVIRIVVSRPRPEGGARVGDLDSFPSGHMVQATLLVVLLPLAVHELTRSAVWRDAVRAILIVGLGVVTAVAISAQRHHATDVIAGAALGLAIGSWGRLALHRVESHRRCRGCRFSIAASGEP